MDNTVIKTTSPAKKKRCTRKGVRNWILENPDVRMNLLFKDARKQVVTSDTTWHRARADARKILGFKAPPKQTNTRNRAFGKKKICDWILENPIERLEFVYKDVADLLPVSRSTWGTGKQLARIVLGIPVGGKAFKSKTNLSEFEYYQKEAEKAKATIECHKGKFPIHRDFILAKAFLREYEKITKYMAKD